MLRKKWPLAVLPGVALIIALVFLSCPDGDEKKVKKTEETKPTTVAKPVISQQTESRRYLAGDLPASFPELSVTAAVSDGGALTYQWYSVDANANTGGAEIAGQTQAAYQPAAPTGVGSAYYYAVVTNPGSGDLKAETTASAPIGIIVLDSVPAADATITVTATEKQYVQGFGGMSNAFSIGAPARYMQMQDIDTMFGPNGLGLKFLRIMIYPNTLQEVISGQVQPQMNHAATYLQAVKRVNQYGGYVLASPWTPPEQYKTNAQARGHLKPTMYMDYAQYLRNFATDMAAQQAPIYAISIQNEPSLEVGYDGMEWTAAEQRDFLGNYGANISTTPTKVAGWGGGKATERVLVTSAEAHQVGTWHTGAVSALLANTQVAQNAKANIDIVAYHIYGGSGDYNMITGSGALTQDTWMTEYNINSQNEAGYYLDSTWDYVWRFADTIHHVLTVNNSNVYIWWYLKRFYCIVGDGSYGTVNNAVMPRGYALSHYAKYATDTVRVDATTTHTGGADICLSAYQRTKTKTSANAQRVEADEDSYSIVIYDKRTSSGSPTSLRINLPAGFTVSKVYGIISDSAGSRQAPLQCILNPDGVTADITLPVNAIASIKLVK